MEDIKKYHEFEKKKESDLEALIKVDGEYQKIKGSIEIEEIIDIIKDPEEISKLESAVAGGIFQASTELQSVKRGDTIWVTAIIKRPGSTVSYNSSSLHSVLKCRIIDIFAGLSKLRDVIK